jgi:hypothetical protein
VATFVAGFLGGPSIVSIFLRAGWSLGVQDRYLFMTDGGDQFCGRIGSGLNFHAGAQFAVLPPRFATDQILSEANWQRICPGYRNHPETFRACLPYFLASIVYHYDWLTAKNSLGRLINISGEHKFWTSRLYNSDMIANLKTQILSPNITGECPVTGKIRR